ncbi:hypothetical protein CR513_30764, partial [Mucuna pruriens]
MAAKVCGICTFLEHPTDMCPILQETESDQPENVRAIGGFQHGKQPYQNRPFDSQQQARQPLSTADSAISNTTFPTTTEAAESAYPRKLSVFGRHDEAVCNKQLGVQQAVSSSNIQFQQNMTATIQDLKTQIGQLANTVNQLQSTGSSNLPSQTIPNPRGNASVVTLKSGKELPQPTLQQLPKPAEVNANPQPRPETAVPLPFPSWTIAARKPESDEELLKMFRKVEINIPLLDAIKQVPKYAKILKELCLHKRRKIKGSREIRGVVSALTKNEELTAGTSRALLRKCRDPRIFSVPCTIGNCTFFDAMLDLGASINVMPASTYRSLNFGDLEPTRMTIQLANRSIVQPLGVLEDVLVQVNKLIFSADFYVLDMEDETSRKGSTLILGRPFLMTARTKIDVHAGMLSMEFSDTLVQFNIFEAMKHPTKDHSLFGIDLLDEIVEEYFQLNSSSEDIKRSAGSTDEISCLESTDEEADYEEVQDLPNVENDPDEAEVKVTETKKSFPTQLATIFTTEIKSANEGRVKEEIKVNSAKKSNRKANTLAEIISTNEDQTQARVEINVPPGSDSKAAQEVKVDSNPTRIETTESSRSKQPKAEVMSVHLVPSQDQVGQTDPSPLTEESPSPPPKELKPLPSHLKYAYLDSEQQLPVIIANSLLQEQEDKLLKVLRQHKKAIGWKLSDLPGINPSICMHRILMEEEVKPVRQQQRRLNPTILNVVKKEVSKLLAASIIYPILDSQWVSLVQVVPKKSGMTVMKNQQDELVSTRIQNSWRVCIDYRRLNQATRKDHFPLPFID